MKAWNKLLSMCAITAVAIVAAGMPAAAGEKDNAVNAAGKYIQQYDYDRSMPLDAELDEVGPRGAFVLYDLEFNSVNGERVPAQFYLPTRGEAPYPCVVVQHGYNGDRSFGGMFASFLAPKGYAVISIDAEYHGARKEEGKDIFSTDVEDDVKALRQTVIDLRRAIDYLATRDDIDMDRIGYTGASMGGFLGALLAGVEDRIKTSILIVGGANWEYMLFHSQVGAFEEIRKSCDREEQCIKDFAAEMAPVEALNFIGRFAPRPLLMINCENDKYVPKAAGEALFEAAGEPKNIKWYTCSGDIAHLPPMAEVLKYEKKWFDRFLK